MTPPDVRPCQDCTGGDSMQCCYEPCRCRCHVASLEMIQDKISRLNSGQSRPALHRMVVTAWRMAELRRMKAARAVEWDPDQHFVTFDHW